MPVEIVNKHNRKRATVDESQVQKFLDTGNWRKAFKKQAKSEKSEDSG